jgi:hypothetical protein
MKMVEIHGLNRIRKAILREQTPWRSEFRQFFPNWDKGPAWQLQRPPCWIIRETVVIEPIQDA